MFIYLIIIKINFFVINYKILKTFQIFKNINYFSKYKLKKKIIQLEYFGNRPSLSNNIFKILNKTMKKYLDYIELAIF